MRFRSTAIVCLTTCSIVASEYAVTVPIPDTSIHGLEEKVTSLGFDLSASYGAVAVAFSNGTKLAIARVDGNQTYKALMEEMSKGDNRGPPWPGSPDEYPIFTDMLGILRDKAESFLGYKVKAALVATPNLPGERTSSLDRALQRLNLKNLDLMVKDVPDGFRQPSAAEAGAGLGLCSDYHDVKACLRENKDMPRTPVLAILYTNNALCVEISNMQSVYSYNSYPTYATSMDFSLGYDERNNNPDPRYYWTAVRDRILRGALGAFPIYKPKLVLIYGDTIPVKDIRLRRAIKDAMILLVGSEIPIYDNDPEFSVAKGAAELARRGCWPYLRNPLKPPVGENTKPGLVLQNDDSRGRRDTLEQITLPQV